MDQPPPPDPPPSPWPGAPHAPGPPDEGWQGEPDRSEASDPGRTGGSGTAWLVVAVVVGLLAIVAGAVVVVRAMSEPVVEEGWAEAWDGRLLDLVAFVEDERELDFEHPVEVRFLPDDEFRAEVTDEGAELGDEERDELERVVAELRALGLVQGDVDLLEAQNQLSGEGVAAYYSAEDRHIAVRGEELTPRIRATLVHELTHALQDQHFDIRAIQEDVGDDGWFRALAVIEGDADRVSRAYTDELPAGGQEELASAGGDVDLTGVPPVMVALFTAPYQLGPPFVSFLHARGGWAAVDGALGEPPSSEAAVLDPRRQLDGVEPVEVGAPELPDGAEVLHEGDFGSLTWFLVLAARAEPAEALELVDGWAGDSYATYEHDGRLCVAARFGAAGADAAERVATALRAWVEDLPAGAASVEQTGEVAELRSCDPGDAGGIEPAHDLSEAMAHPQLRLELLTSLATSAPFAEVDDLWCFATAVLDELTLEDLTADQLPPERQGAVSEAAEGCGLVA